MQQLNLKQIGSFVKTHGVHGQLVMNFSDNFNSGLIKNGLQEQEAVFVELDGIPVPFFISVKGIRNLNENAVILALEDIDNKKANDFCGCRVFIESIRISENTGNENISIEDCIGFLVYDADLVYIGKFVEFIGLKGNPMLRIDVNGKELLIPLISDFITSINVDKSEIYLQLPEDYIDALLQD
jgi:16S rRNA processing protein RimM